MTKVMLVLRKENNTLNLRFLTKTSHGQVKGENLRSVFFYNKANKQK